MNLKGLLRKRRAVTPPTPEQKRRGKIGYMRTATDWKATALSRYCSVVDMRGREYKFHVDMLANAQVQWVVSDARDQLVAGGVEMNTNNAQEMCYETVARILHPGE